jgi:hypothetical protein
MTNPASIYVRTTQGRVTAFNPSAKLSPALKAVLKGVDGRTASDLLMTKFADFGDVSKLLGALEAEKHGKQRFRFSSTFSPWCVGACP